MVAVKSILLAVAGFVSLAQASPITPSEVQLARQQPNNDTSRAQAAPTWYSGPWYNFPPMDTWLSFDAMFDRNKDSMKSTGSTWDDIGRINVAIRNAAQLGVDERVILGIIMQESHGYVGVRTTVSPDGIPTAGIMQCSGCPGYPGRTGLSQVCGGPQVLFYVAPSIPVPPCAILDVTP